MAAGDERRRARDDLAATVEARRELGREREDELIEGYLDRIAGELERRPRAGTEVSSRRAAREPDKSLLALMIVSLGISIPLTEKAVDLGGGLGLFAVAFVWAGIVALNGIYSQR